MIFTTITAIDPQLWWTASPLYVEGMFLSLLYAAETRTNLPRPQSFSSLPCRFGCKAYKMKACCSSKTTRQVPGNDVQKAAALSFRQAGQKNLYNNTKSINTQANCQQLITSHLCQDGADEIILPFFHIWPSGALTSSLMRFNFWRQGGVKSLRLV